MNRFVIVDNLPYLVANGKTYGVRWDEKGFTVGTEVKLVSVPCVTHTELAVMAQCGTRLDSIGDEKPKAGRRKKMTEKAVNTHAADG